MVSEYLKGISSIEELDKIIDHDREVAANIAKTVFNLEVSTAIANIGEINQVSSARILANSQIISAKMLSDAEAMATLLSSKAEIAVLEIKRQKTDELVHSATSHDTVLLISQNTNASISNTAQESVEAIARGAQNAIDNLQDNATKAIEEIMSLADKVTAEIEENAATAKELLNKEKRQPRTPQGVVHSAEDQAQKIADDALRSSMELQKVKDKVIADFKDFVDQTSTELTESARTSERRVLGARDNALLRIDEVVAQLDPG